MPEYPEVPPEVVARLADICLGLPETIQEPAWTGVRWRIRKRAFAHVLGVEGSGGPATIISFRSSEPELDILRRAGHPFFRAGWGANVIGMVIDAEVDWVEVRELLTESYCILAPKKLAALVDRPAE